MVGGTLRDIREHVEALSAEDGPYAVVCGRTGREPVPAAGVRFGDRESAAEAAEASSEYRSVLRRYDPQVQYLEPLVHEVSDGPVGPLASESDDVRARYFSFCHDVAGAVFEALSATGHREVESATMETYLTLAEVVSDRDDFCLTMLWSMMSELDVRLGPGRQATVVRSAADMLGSPAVESAANSPVEATMRRLSSSSFVGDYRVVPCPDGDAWEISFGDYALAERTGRLPTLPLAVDLVRRVPDRPVRFTDATALSDCRWRVRVEMDRDPEGLTSLTASDDGYLNDPDYCL
ncbi:DUF7551 domain-containing protein [Halopelagius fulvigenes]|uniref:Uncharacterized protein n=1 Tax=Halopelagius fulvigenes TaxID=1198324 RepID=A0ABD5TZW5_9EURY